MKDLVIIKTFTDRMEANIAKGFLEANGIPAFVKADDSGGAEPFPFANVPGVDLVIRQEDYEKAKKLFEQN